MLSGHTKRGYSILDKHRPSLRCEESKRQEPVLAGVQQRARLAPSSNLHTHSVWPHGAWEN